MSRTGLATRYAAFAAIATLINLATQWMSFRLYHGPGELMAGIAAGTAAGLASKYLLDKFWIFGDRSVGLVENVHKFGFYSLTGILTTALFWGTESAFALVGNEAMRYLGAVLGLTVGNVLKFHLDQRFVFRAKS